MEKVTFGEWLPDQPPVAGALVEAKNVIPQQIGYGPLPSISAISNDASENLNGVFLVDLAIQQRFSPLLAQSCLNIVLVI